MFPGGGWGFGPLARILVSLARHLRDDWVKRGRSILPEHINGVGCFFAIKIARHFEFRADWYRQGEVAALVLDYYVVVRSVLRDKPLLRPCLTRCWHCGIFFFTNPSNAQRIKTIGCPFGCRETHRRQASTRRSVACNRTPEGKRKKSALNQKSRASRVAPVELATLPEVVVAPVALANLPPVAGRQVSELEPEVLTWDELMVEHVRMVGSLIEGRRVSRQEVLELLAKQMRQHTHCRRTQLDYTVAWLNQHPP